MLRKSLLICYDSSRIKTPVTEFPKCGYEHLLTRPCTVINESAQCAAHIWTMKLIYQPITLDRLIIAWSIIQVSNYVIASDVKCVPMFISFFVIFIVEIVMMGISWIHKNLDRCWNTCTNNPPRTWVSKHELQPFLLVMYVVWPRVPTSYPWSYAPVVPSLIHGAMHLLCQVSWRLATWNELFFFRMWSYLNDQPLNLQFF